MDENYFKNGVTHQRTASTVNHYLTRAHQLIEAGDKAGLWNHGLPLPLRVETLFRSIQTGLMPSTQRLYKASLAAYLESVGDFPGAHALRQISTISKPPKAPKRTSSLKAKSVTSSDLAVLSNAASHRSPAAQASVRWLAASTLTGLRPIEWASCSLIDRDGRSLLRLSNAKATHGRSHGLTRTLDISGLAPDDRQTIVLHLAWLADQSATGVPFDRIYHRARKSLQALCAEVFPRRKRRPCLYSARHQFSATAKKEGSLIEVAAMLGHATTRTAPAHYQGVRFAGSASGIKPIQEDVDKVRDTYAPALIYPKQQQT